MPQIKIQRVSASRKMKSNKFYWNILRARHFNVFQTNNRTNEEKKVTAASLLLSIYILFSSGHSFATFVFFFVCWFVFSTSLEFLLKRIIVIHITGSLTLSLQCVQVYLLWLVSSGICYCVFLRFSLSYFVHIVLLIR